MPRYLAYICLAGITFVFAPGTVLGSEFNAAQTCAARDALGTTLQIQPDLTWGTIRDACETVVAVARAADPVGDSWYANAGNGFTGTPLVLFKLLPDLSPDLFGDPASYYAGFGLFPDPDDPGRILPRGLGVTGRAGRPLGPSGDPIGQIDYTMPQPLFVTLACGACHSGQIDLGDRRLTLEGAPNTQFDVRKWRAAFIAFRERHLTSDQIGSTKALGPTTATLLKLVENKPEGFFARGLPGITEAQIGPVDAAQRAVFAKNAVAILTSFAQGTAVRGAAVALQTRSGSSYGQGDRSPGLGGHSAGQSDGSGDLLADLLAARAAAEGHPTLLEGPLPPELPRFATVTDIPSIWGQADRSVGQWDGSVLERFWRNIAAQLPIIGDPGAVDLANAAIVAEFLMGLPPPPYPFPVDLTRAARGEELFAENCGSCHRPRNEQRYPEIGTDMNRAAVLNPAGSALLLAAFRAACHDLAFAYRDRDGRLVRPCVMPSYRILRDTTEVVNQGYLAPPLDGIWARAPYLHNGSVPTLRHLLVPDSRPREFLRGVIAYDPEAVGWDWAPERRAEFVARYPTVSVQDTTRDGWSARGHDRDLTVEGKTYRLDWSGPDRAADLEDLLEYLKTR